MERYEKASFRDSMRLRVDFNNMMADRVGERGITAEELAALKARGVRAAEAVEAARGSMKWRGLPFNSADVAEAVLSAAADIRARYESFVVLGIGGSALGPIAVHYALDHIHYNELPALVRGGPKLYIEDNIDPERLEALLDVIDPATTMFNVVTKSGSTSETMAQFLIVCDLLRSSVGEAFNEHIIVTTDSEKGNLIKLAHELGFAAFVVPDGVGGRFSELCPVGLLPAAVCGTDIKELLAGAAYMDGLCFTTDMERNPALMLAVLETAAMGRGCNISVMMPYAESLRYMADWYAQLWAESLGKRCDRDGAVVNAGQTPVKALGVTDQHSQVQLYTEGPYDKVVTFIAVDEYRTVIPIPGGCESVPDVSFLSGHSLNELITAERRATEYALMRSGRMNKTIMLPEINAFTVGELLCLFELQTAFAGELLNVNAFDQPGVEEGKNAAYALLGRPGYDDKRRELASAPAPDRARII